MRTIESETELKNITKFKQVFDKSDPLILESGEKLTEVNAAYQTYGKLNAEGTNVIHICHALTGNSHVTGLEAGNDSDPNSSPDLLKKYSESYKSKPGWWNDLIGTDKVFDTNKYFVVCSNVLGSCYGTTGPVSINPATQKPYQADFPTITVRDMVKVQKRLLDKLGVNKIELTAGGSLGGMQVLEWAAMYPDFVKKIVPIATSAKHSAWAIGISEVEKNAIMNDPVWNGGFYKEQPYAGLSLARKIAMLSYRSFPSYEEKFTRGRMPSKDDSGVFKINSYLEYQGKKLVERFDANTYIRLTDAMDLHDLGYNRSSVEEVLSQIKAKTLVVGISTDVLYPVEEQLFIQKHIPGAKYMEINSIHGHDAFLIELDQLSEMIKEFL